jgi:uncharacterized protein YwgA
MTLYLATEKRHAFLAYAIKEARKVVGKNSGYVGRTALQKIMYFAQRKDVPLPYRFDLYFYGPFCADIYTDIEYLEEDDVVKDTSTRKQKYSNYAPAENIDELLERHAREIETYSTVIRALVQGLAPLKPEHLELFATVDYLFQQEYARNPQGPWKTKVIDRFMQIKNGFTRNNVNRAYEVLDKEGLLKA